MRAPLLALFCLGLLTACGDSTQSLRELRYATPNADPYQAALASGYQQLAEEKLAAYNWDDSERFADKGLLAAYGRDIAPEDPLTWHVEGGELIALNEARGQLIEALTATKTTQPNQAATAMVRYDRWLSLAANNLESDDTRAAHEAFGKSLAAIQVVQAAEPGTQAPTSEPQPALPEPLAPTATAAPAPAKPKLDITVLYFPFDQASLGASAKTAINGIVDKIHAAAASAQVTINGHTDRAGTDAYNLDLSERRARYVKNALAKAGIPDSRMQALGFGESDPAVPTADGVREPKNRRVEIFVE